MKKSMILINVGMGLLLLASCKENSEKTNNTSADEVNVVDESNNEDSEIKPVAYNADDAERESITSTAVAYRDGERINDEPISNEKKGVMSTSPKNYGIKTKIYDPKEVDRLPLFSEACKDSKEPEECSSEKLNDYVTKSITYPKKALNEGKHGTEYVQFVIDEKGNILPRQYVSTKGEDCEACREAALAVFKNMGTWVPGIRNGKTVAVEMTLPIKFDIQDI